MKDSSPKSSVSKYLRYTSIPFQMGLTIYLGHMLGEWVEGRYGDGEGLYIKSITLIAVFLSMFRVIREVIKLTNTDDGKK